MKAPFNRSGAGAIRPILEPVIVSSTRVPICTGENLARRQGFRDFIIHHGCDILNPDLRNTGGFLETKRMADMAESARKKR
jgi:L-alanine-DL-glutamate epimerase-like enolase superfamily enzyme